MKKDAIWMMLAVAALADLPRFSQPVITEDFKTAANSLGVR
jgi:hypothetical protein